MPRPLAWLSLAYFFPIVVISSLPNDIREDHENSLHPDIHFIPSTPCIGVGDIAGAVSINGVHSVFQLLSGGNSTNGGLNGWNHATSEDFVRFNNVGVSIDDWPSGFAVHDEENDEMCAGMRTDSIPSDGGQEVDSSMAMRCSPLPPSPLAGPYDFGEPEKMFNVYNWRFAPYDPFRPILDEEGFWNVGVAFDGCNDTHAYGDDVPKPPCEEGGGFTTWKSKDLRGGDWEQNEDFTFLTNRTVFGTDTEGYEMVTIDFFTPPLVGVPFPENIQHPYRVLLNNPYYARGSTEYFIGTQEVSPSFSPFTFDPNVNKNGSQWMLDWSAFRPRLDGTGFGKDALNQSEANHPSGGSYRMTRTLGEEGRRVAYSWVGGLFNGMSIGRDLALDASTGYLMQRFVPEISSLRVGDGAKYSSLAEEGEGDVGGSGRTLELHLKFSNWGRASNKFGLNVLAEEGGSGDKCEVSYRPKNGLLCVDCSSQPVPEVPTEHAGDVRCGPLLPDLGQEETLDIHVIVDKSYVSIIANNFTAITASASPKEESYYWNVFKGQEDDEVEYEVYAWNLTRAN